MRKDSEPPPIRAFEEEFDGGRCVPIFQSDCHRPFIVPQQFTLKRIELPACASQIAPNPQLATGKLLARGIGKRNAPGRVGRVYGNGHRLEDGEGSQVLLMILLIGKNRSRE